MVVIEMEDGGVIEGGAGRGRGAEDSGEFFGSGGRRIFMTDSSSIE